MTATRKRPNMATIVIAPVRESHINSISPFISILSERRCLSDGDLGSATYIQKRTDTSFAAKFTPTIKFYLERVENASRTWCPLVKRPLRPYPLMALTSPRPFDHPYRRALHERRSRKKSREFAPTSYYCERRRWGVRRDMEKGEERRGEGESSRKYAPVRKVEI